MRGFKQEKKFKYLQITLIINYTKLITLWLYTKMEEVWSYVLPDKILFKSKNWLGFFIPRKAIPKFSPAVSETFLRILFSV